MSKSSVGKVLELFYSTSDGRKNTMELSVDEKGVLKDKFYNKNIQRSVLIASLDSYNLAKEHGIDATRGALGENLLIDYNPYHLYPGARLMIGETVLEISQLCTLCASLGKEDVNLPKLLKDDRGIFAKVVSGTIIKKDDTVYLLSE